MTSVKIFCHCCDGEGTVEEKSYPERKTIVVLCPECDGKKYVTAEGLNK